MSQIRATLIRSKSLNPAPTGSHSSLESVKIDTLRYNSSPQDIATIVSCGSSFPIVSCGSSFPIVSKGLLGTG